MRAVVGIEAIVDSVEGEPGVGDSIGVPTDGNSHKSAPIATARVSIRVRGLDQIGSAKLNTDHRGAVVPEGYP
jgi:hypothetical protein